MAPSPAGLDSVRSLRTLQKSGKTRAMREHVVALRAMKLGMHVLHVGKYYPPYRGGIETVVGQLCRGMIRRGLQVTALVSNDGPATIDETIDGVRVLRLGRTAELNSQPLNLRLVPMLRRIRFDALHFHTPNPVGALAVLAAQRPEPIVVTHHSDIVRQRLLGAPATVAQSLLYRRAAALIAATPKHVEYSPALRRFESKCRVIHFPIDAVPYDEAPSTWDEQLPLAWRTEPLVLFVGRLVYYKGIDVLLDAFKHIEWARLAVVGVGPLATRLAEQTARLGIQERVKFLGAVSEHRLRSLYKCARFLVLPSVAPSEAFGMVQLEAMAAGRPVVSTDLKSGVPYVNQHGVTGLIVPPSDSQALAAAMKWLLENGPGAQAMGQAAQRRVLAEFHVDKVVDAHVDLYTSLLERTPRSAS